MKQSFTKEDVITMENDFRYASDNIKLLLHFKNGLRTLYVRKQASLRSL